MTSPPSGVILNKNLLTTFLTKSHEPLSIGSSLGLWGFRVIGSGLDCSDFHGLDRFRVARYAFQSYRVEV